MDETRVRAIIREEIALAMKTLGEVAERREDSDLDAVTYDFRAYAYRGACDEADEQRAEDAENPFEEKPVTGPDSAVTAAIRAEVLGVLKELRHTFYMSGLDDDYRIAERLDGLITRREASDE
jgi:hypothetical protein